MAPANRKNPTRADSSESRYSLMEFMKEFPDDKACLEWLWYNRHASMNDKAHCPKCDERRLFKRYETTQQRQSWTCTACGHHIHPTAGTIFHKSSTSLHLWFYAMYLMTSTRCGISAKQIERELGVTYKTAWRMANLIRNDLMTVGDGQLTGSVEIDETYIGGRYKRTGETNERFANKTRVVGMVERHGRVIAMPISRGTSARLMRIITERVLPATLIYTDDAPNLRRVGKRGYEHRRINHSEKIYVSGDVHTNTIEGFWSLLKRGIDGVYHSVSAKHLQGYLNEYAWRYNARKDPRGHFRALALRAASR